MTYSLDFRKKVIEISIEENLTCKETAIRFKIGTATFTRWKKRIKPILKRNKKPSKISNQDLLNDIEKFNDSTCLERAKRLKASSSGISKAMRRLKITYKKNSSSPQNRSK